jgi:uncharacterized membrane protein
MRSHAELLGHSVHQMLIVFPLGLLATSVVFDLVAAGTGNQAVAIAAFWMLSAGILGALAAAPFGLIDWLHIPRGTRARRIGAVHGGGNLIVTLLFVASWFLRDLGAAAPASAITLSVIGALLALVTGWLGGELVSQLGVGVHEDSGLDAPSSLRHHKLAH